MNGERKKNYHIFLQSEFAESMNYIEKRKKYSTVLLSDLVLQTAECNKHPPCYGVGICYNYAVIGGCLFKGALRVFPRPFRHWGGDSRGGT